jgi:hypothetical protein
MDLFAPETNRFVQCTQTMYASEIKNKIVNLDYTPYV